MTAAVEKSKATAATWTGGDEAEVLTFELNGELFALGAVLVQEITDLVAETAVPGAGAFAGSV
ncbi:MAG: chemotaxis protein CheW, partial [Caulobacteraceae bacterium]